MQRNLIAFVFLFLVTGCVQQGPILDEYRIVDVEITVSTTTSTAVLNMNSNRWVYESIERDQERFTDSQLVTGEKWSTLSQYIVDKDVLSLDTVYENDGIFGKIGYNLIVRYLEPGVNPELADPAYVMITCFSTCPSEFTQVMEMVESISGRHLIQD